MNWQEITTLKYRNLEVPVRRTPEGGAYIDGNDLPDDLWQAFFQWMLGSTYTVVEGARNRAGFYVNDFDGFMKKRGIGLSGNFSAIVDKYL